MTDPQAVNDFWLNQVGPKGWYEGGAALDAQIRDRFLPLWQVARAGGLQHWLSSPEGALAYLVVTDQFPRNMFRDDARAFSTDTLAVSAAKWAIGSGVDLLVPPPQRQFFYLPLMHSESLPDQERSVRLFMMHMPDAGGGNLPHARAHREIIRRFGRFPYRNKALGRTNTPAEADFLHDAGYGAVLNALPA